MSVKKARVDHTIMPVTVDTLIHAKYVVPIQPTKTVLTDHTIVINKGVIQDIVPTSDASNKYTSDNVHTMSTHAVMPGLVNAHTHVGMTLLRGYSDDLCLSDWLQKEIWPAEGNFVSPEFVSVSSELGLAEMIRSGTTCINEMYWWPQSIVDVVGKVGTRACVGIPCLEFPSSYGTGPDDYLAKGKQLLIDNKNSTHADRVTFAIAPHAPYTVSDATFNKVRQFSTDHSVQVHTHLHETVREVDHSTSGSGHAKHISDNLCAPLQNFDSMQLLNDKLIAVHMTALSDVDIKLLSDKHVNVVHCPHSNLKLASGFCPTAKLLQAGVNVGIGTDSTASNNRLDMFAEMKTASLLSKCVSLDATAMSAYQTLYAATMGGATALNLHSKIGSIEVGKCADLIAIDLDAVELMPMYDVMSHLAYAVDGRHVSDVWVNGKQILQSKQLLTIDLPTLVNQTKKYQTQLADFKAQQNQPTAT